MKKLAENKVSVPWPRFTRVLLLNMLLVGLSIGVAAGAVELVFRWMELPVAMGDPNPYEKHVGWALQPNASFNFRLPTGDRVLNRINSHGLRDIEHTYRKPSNTFRILIVGDSFVAAHQVTLDNAFYRILQDRLNASPPQGYDRVEIIAAGTSGWGTDNELLYYRYEGFRYEPDIVLGLFVPNDVPDNHWPLQSWIEGGDGTTPTSNKPYFVLEPDGLCLHNHPVQMRGPVKQWLRQFRIYRPLSDFKGFVQDTVTTYRKRARQTQIMEALQVAGSSSAQESGFRRDLLGLAHPHTFLYLADIPPVYKDAWHVTTALLKMFKEEVQQSNAKFVSVNATNDQDVEIYKQSQLEKRFQTRGMRWDWDAIGNQMSTINLQLSIPYLDLVPAFRDVAKSAPSTLHIPGDGHWSVAGHALAADLIAEWVVSNSFWSKQSL